ncbi:MAG: cytochrome C, partial [Candidatus Lindowbacteria bacterium]|nr:cytochrome C [Candidatus Lindowbacteria bacterium]
QGKCTACHSPHASDERFLMRQNKRELCAACHKGYDEKLKLKVVHDPVLKGQCELCHEPHAGSTPRLLKVDVLELCKRCHAEEHKVSHPYGQGVIDPRTQSILDCISCHDPHSSDEEFLTYYNRDRDLCIQCHKKV